MGKNSKIEWTDHTFNPWWGCAKISPACENCYAMTTSNHWGYDLWGTNKNRRFFPQKHWNQPLLWNKRAEKAGVPIKVFCGSMCDIFEDRQELHDWRVKLWILIERTPNLTWMLLTKRPENVTDMFFPSWTKGRQMPSNIWIGVTAENQEMADQRIPVLVNIPVATKFISVEPMLGWVNLLQWIDFCPLDEQRPEKLSADWRMAGDHWQHYHGYPLGHESTIPKPQIDWVICGGESGAHARITDISWVKHLQHQCARADIPFFLKQLNIDGKLTKMPELDGKIWAEFPKEILKGGMR